MYLHLFEKDSRDIFLIYQELKKSQSIWLDDLCEITGFYEKKIRRAIMSLQALIDMNSLSIRLFVKRKIVYLQTDKTFSEKIFLSQLFKPSLSCSILNEIIQNSPLTRNELEKNVHASPSTVRKKMKQLLPLLNSYDIKMISSFPLLSGDEMQIRCLAFSLSLVTDPVLDPSPVAYYQRIQMIQQSRIQFNYRMEQASLSQTLKLPEYVPSFFSMSEQNFLFFWQQLTGVEMIYPPAKITKAIQKSLSAVFPEYHENFEQNSALIADIYRILIWSTVSLGDMLLVSPAFSPDTCIFKFMIELKYNIPAYGKFLFRHPNSAILYDKVLQKYQVIGENLEE